MTPGERLTALIEAVRKRDLDTARWGLQFKPGFVEIEIVDRRISPPLISMRMINFDTIFMPTADPDFNHILDELEAHHKGEIRKSLGL